MPASAGTRAYKKRSDEMAAETRKRKTRAAAQKAAREALAYPDAPNGLTPEALLEQHRQMKAACLRRMAERAAA
jgi:hypothetical protein